MREKPLPKKTQFEIKSFVMPTLRTQSSLWLSKSNFNNQYENWL